MLGKVEITRMLIVQPLHWNQVGPILPVVSTIPFVWRTLYSVQSAYNCPHLWLQFHDTPISNDRTRFANRSQWFDASQPASMHGRPYQCMVPYLLKMKMYVCVCVYAYVRVDSSYPPKVNDHSLSSQTETSFFRPPGNSNFPRSFVRSFARSLARSRWCVRAQGQEEE